MPYIKNISFVRRLQKSAILLLLLSLVGCTGNSAAIESLSSVPEVQDSSISAAVSESGTMPEGLDSSAKPEDSIPDESYEDRLAELMQPGVLTIYTYAPDTALFSPNVVTITEEITYAKLVDQVAQALGTPIPIRAIYIKPKSVTMDLSQDFVDSQSADELERILNTLAATLEQNLDTYHLNVWFTVDGSTQRFDVPYPTPPLKLTDEAYTEIRAQVPYAGLLQPLDEFFLEPDDTTKKLANYLSLLQLWNHTYTSPGDLDNERILYAAICATQSYSTEPTDRHYEPVLKPLESAASGILGFRENSFRLEEHVEESVRLLFGDIPFTHEEFYDYPYLEKIGAYTSPHRGGGGITIPIILHYEDTGDYITAEVVYLVEGMGEFLYAGDSGEEIPREQVEAYAQTTAPRFAVTVKKLPEDWFVLESQIPIQD